MCPFSGKPGAWVTLKLAKDGRDPHWVSSGGRVAASDPCQLCLQLLHFLEGNHHAWTLQGQSTEPFLHWGQSQRIFLLPWPVCLFTVDSQSSFLGKLHFINRFPQLILSDMTQDQDSNLWRVMISISLTYFPSYPKANHTVFKMYGYKQPLFQSFNGSSENKDCKIMLLNSLVLIILN